MKFAVGVFEGPGAWPLIVAQRQSFFSEQGVLANIVTVSDAREMYDLVARKELDGVVTAFDNMLATDADGSIGTLGMRAIASYVEGGLAVVGKDDTVDPIRLGVDHPDSGFAIYARDWLARTGRTDPAIIETGGTAERFAALSGGSIDATVLHPPFVAAAKVAGFEVLDSLDERGLRYQTAVLAVRGDWSAGTDATRRVVAAYCKASNWLADPANREEAIALLAEASPDLPKPAIERIYGALGASFSRDGVINGEAVETVRGMRAAITGVVPPTANSVIDFAAAQGAACLASDRCGERR